MVEPFRKSQVFQIGTLYRAFEHVQDFSCAVDVGANDGDWTEAMAWKFEKVFAFEPASDAYTKLCWYLGNMDNVIATKQAVFERRTTVTLTDHPHRPGDSRARYVVEGGTTPAISIDYLELPSCGLLKVDVEGQEVSVLRGARNTLTRCKPIVIVECDRLGEKFGFDSGAPLRYLLSLGAREIFRRGIDHVYGWA